MSKKDSYLVAGVTVPANQPSQAELDATAKFEKIADSFGVVLAALRSAFPNAGLGELKGEAEALQSIAYARGELTALRDVLTSRLAVTQLPEPRNGWLGSQPPVDKDSLFFELKLTSKEIRLLEGVQEQSGFEGKGAYQYMSKTTMSSYHTCRDLEAKGLFFSTKGRADNVTFYLSPAGAALLKIRSSAATNLNTLSQYSHSPE